MPTKETTKAADVAAPKLEKKSLRQVYSELYEEQERRKVEFFKKSKLAQDTEPLKLVKLSDTVKIKMTKDFGSMKAGKIQKVNVVMAKYYVDNGVAQEVK